MKVLHGMAEVAGQNIYSVKGLRRNGVDAHMAVWRKNPSDYEVELDVGIGECKFLYPWYALKMLIFAIKTAKKYDCFHFHFGHSLLPYGMDLPFLKTMNKKIFFEFHGSEIRGVIRNVPYKYFKVKEGGWLQKRKILKIAKYADGFILHDAELCSHLPKCDVPVYIVPLRLDIDRCRPHYPDPEEKVPLIVHAPSNRGNKGTEHILKAIEEIKMPCSFVIVENKTQKEAFEVYKQADIIVDQIVAGTYGVFSIEAMALGKPVITYISEEMRETFPKTIPIISAQPDTIKEAVEELLLDGKRRHWLGKKGREYVEEYHDYKKNGELLKKIYEGRED